MSRARPRPCGVKRVIIRNAIYGIQGNLGVGSKQQVWVWAVRNGLLDHYRRVIIGWAAVGADRSCGPVHVVFIWLAGGRPRFLLGGFRRAPLLSLSLASYMAYLLKVTNLPVVGGAGDCSPALLGSGVVSGWNSVECSAHDAGF